MVFRAADEGGNKERPSSGATKPSRPSRRADSLGLTWGQSESQNAYITIRCERLIPRRIGRQHRKSGLLRTAQRAFEPLLKLPEILGADQLSHLEASQGHSIAAPLTFDPESALEAGEIAGSADVFEGHPPPLIG